MTAMTDEARAFCERWFPKAAAIARRYARDRGLDRNEIESAATDGLISLATNPRRPADCPAGLVVYHCMLGVRLYLRRRKPVYGPNLDSILASKNKQAARPTNNVGGDLNYYPAAGEYDPSEILENAEYRGIVERGVRRAVGLLEPHHKRVVEGVYFRGETLVQVAESLGKHAETVGRWARQWKPQLVEYLRCSEIGETK